MEGQASERPCRIQKHRAASVIVTAQVDKIGTKQRETTAHKLSEELPDFDRAIAIMQATRENLEPQGAWEPRLRNDLALAYLRRAGAKVSAPAFGPSAAIEDYDHAIALMEAVREALEPPKDWYSPFPTDLAAAYLDRGNVKQAAQGYGPTAAIADYDRAITLLDDLSHQVETRGACDPAIQRSLANAYINRGVAIYAAGGDSDEPIRDYDRAIALLEALRKTLEPRGAWSPPLRKDLATAYLNRGNARATCANHGPEAANADYSRAIALMEALRKTLEPRGAWDAPTINTLAGAYMNRGNVRRAAAGYGPKAAISDYDQAIGLRKELREVLDPRGAWDPPLQKALANAYLNRGIAVQAVRDLADDAIPDYTQAIALMEALRRILEPQAAWSPTLRNDLAAVYLQRGQAWERIGKYSSANLDRQAARLIADGLGRAG